MSFQKKGDSVKHVNELIREAQEIFKRQGGEGRIIISMVLPDNLYKHENPDKPHQGHTFAIYRNTEKLMIVDNEESTKYYNVSNYKFIIDSLCGDRDIVFAYKQPLDCLRLAEGSCWEYIKQLENNGTLYCFEDILK